MPDLNTDPKMMRDQQDKDTPQHIDEDETHGGPERSDSDPRSGAERESARDGKLPASSNQQDAIFQQNRACAAHEATGDDDAGADVDDKSRDGSGHDGSGLVRKGRSLLGK